MRVNKETDWPAETDTPTLASNSQDAHARREGEHGRGQQLVLHMASMLEWLGCTALC